MHGKVFFGLLLIVPTLSFCQTCPTVAQIKQGSLSGWVIYDSEDGSPLNPQQVARFKQSITQFILAEWVKHKPHTGMMHCYYRDKTGSNLEAYLAKDNFLVSSSPYWYSVSGAMQCAAAMDKCLFQPSTPLVKTQFARR